MLSASLTALCMDESQSFEFGCFHVTFSADAATGVKTIAELMTSLEADSEALPQVTQYSAVPKAQNPTETESQFLKK